MEDNNNNNSQTATATNRQIVPIRQLIPLCTTILFIKIQKAWELYIQIQIRLLVDNNSSSNIEIMVIIRLLISRLTFFSRLWDLRKLEVREV